MNIVFLMVQNASQECYKIILHLYQLKNSLHILVELLECIQGNLKEFQFENIIESDSFLAPTFVNYYLLSDVTFSGLCLINNNISNPKKVINLYISFILNL